MSSLGVVDILRLHGFDAAPKTAKIVRHKDDRFDVDELRRNGWLDLYQAYQSKPRFEGAETIVSFYGLTGNRSSFYGVFKVNGCRGVTQRTAFSDCPWERDWRKTSTCLYDLERVPGFESLEHRLIVGWHNPISWCQWLSNMPVLELLPPGRKLQPFRDYLEFSLTFRELCELCAAPEAHRDWQNPLQAVAGVYLILAETTGELYVGSAYGAGGVWGRWAQYAKTKHGGNKRLADLLSRDSTYPEKFRFSLLQILPKSFTRDEVIARETLFKRKLGSRATGLNLN